MVVTEKVSVLFAGTELPGSNPTTLILGVPSTVMVFVSTDVFCESRAVMVNVCTPMSWKIGVHVKVLVPEEKLLGVALEFWDPSPTVYVGAEKPVEDSVKETGVPKRTVLPGSGSLALTVGAMTVIVLEAFALLPCESLTVTVRVCAPTLSLFGVQWKLPCESILTVVTPPGNESTR